MCTHTGRYINTCTFLFTDFRKKIWMGAYIAFIIVMCYECMNVWMYKWMNCTYMCVCTYMRLLCILMYVCMYILTHSTTQTAIHFNTFTNSCLFTRSCIEKNPHLAAISLLVKKNVKSLFISRFLCHPWLNVSKLNKFFFLSLPLSFSSKSKNKKELKERRVNKIRVI